MDEVIYKTDLICETNNINQQRDVNTIQTLREIDRNIMSWSDTVHYQDNPIIANYCQGEIITDLQGNNYIDTQMWHSSCNFGYRNMQIENAVRHQLDQLPQVSGDFLHVDKLLLAKEVEEAIFERTGQHGRISFNVGGTLVVEDALKIVRRHTGKSKVGAFMGAYHGRSLTVSGLSSSHRYRQPFGEFPQKAEQFAFPNPADCYYELPQGQSQSDYYARMITKRFENDFYGIATDEDQELGGFFLELCQGRGYTIPPLDFYQKFVPQLQQRGMLMVDDEIQIGMFRTGKLFAFEHFNIQPDIITLSKSFSNGLSPLSMVWAKGDLAAPDNFGPGHAHSNFANHSLGTAAALATWKYMLSQNYEITIPQKGGYYLSRLKELKNKYWFIGSVDGLGLLLNLVFKHPDGRPLKGLGKLAVTIGQDNDFFYQGRPYRLILNAGGFSCEGLKLAPYLDISYAEIHRTIALLDQVVLRLAHHLQTQGVDA